MFSRLLMRWCGKLAGGFGVIVLLGMLDGRLLRLSTPGKRQPARRPTCGDGREQTQGRADRDG
jgi:hypothetical protein